MLNYIPNNHYYSIKVIDVIQCISVFLQLFWRMVRHCFSSRYPPRIVRIKNKLHVCGKGSNLYNINYRQTQYSLTCVLLLLVFAKVDQFILNWEHFHGWGFKNLPPKIRKSFRQLGRGHLAQFAFWKFCFRERYSFGKNVLAVWFNSVNKTRRQT